MPRKSLSEVSKGGIGFEGGRVLIQDSYSTVFQYPPNSTTNQQSDPFPALVWKGVRVNDEGKVIEHDGVNEEVEIIQRMGGLDMIRPGLLDKKDWDDQGADPEDLGQEVDVRGNTFYVEADCKGYSRGWGFMEESLKKAGFKPDLLGRAIMDDFTGMDATFKTVEGAKYIAKQGAKKGQEVTPTNLVCERIWVYPYDKPRPSSSKSTVTPGQKPPVAGKSVVVKSAAAGKPAPAPTPAEDTAEQSPAMQAALSVVANFTDKFKAAVGTEPVKRDAFTKALVNELMRQKVPGGLQNAVMGLFKNAESLVEIAGVSEGVLSVDDPDAPTTVTVA